MGAFQRCVRHFLCSELVFSYFYAAGLAITVDVKVFFNLVGFCVMRQLDGRLFMQSLFR